MSATYLCDIDGTLTDLSHRLHFITGEKKDWDAFYDACDRDSPIQSVVTTIQLLNDAGASIILVSGRTGRVREKTVNWLQDHYVPYSRLYMRREGDHREDYIVKEEILDSILGEIGDSIVGVFDDRQQVVDMFRRRGLKVFQVAEGKF